MSQGCRPGLVLMALGVLACAGPAAAQPGGGSGRPRPYVAISPEGDLEQILKTNLEQVRGLEKIRGLLDTFRDLPINPDLRRRLEQGDPSLLTDPKTQKLIEDVLKNLSKNPELLENVRKQVPNLDIKDKKSIEDIKKAFEEQKKAINNPPVLESGPKPPQPNGPPAPATMPGQDPERSFTEALRGWLERLRSEDLEGIGDVIRDSPAIQEAVEDMTRALLNNEAVGINWNAGGMMDRLGNVADLADRGFSAFRDGFSVLRNISLPPLPRISFPRMNLGGMPSFRLPRFGGPGAGGATAVGHAFLWIALLLALGLLLWQVRARLTGGGLQAREGTGRALGPWPVDPAHVASREELIQAFEYLAVLKLGPDARAWNHHDVAAALGPEAPEGSARQEAARRLAARYEEARYAPGTDPLPGPALAEARHDLCYLAGVAAA